MPPTLTVRSLNHWAAREVPPRVLFIVFLVGSFKQLVSVSLLLISWTHHLLSLGHQCEHPELQFFPLKASISLVNVFLQVF